MKSIFFTGHRFIKKTEINVLKQQLYAKLSTMAEQGYTVFYAGGALGWDTMCEETVLMLKETNPQVKLNLILPCAPENQTAKWKKSDIERYSYILSRADNIEFVSKEYTPDCMYERNKMLVNTGGYCICYYDKKRPASGTGQTFRMAEHKNLPICNFYRQ